MRSSDHVIETEPGAGPSVTALLATLAALAQVDPTSLTQVQAHAELLGLQQAENSLHALYAQRAAAFDQQGHARGDGLRSAKSWLRAFAHRSARSASALLSHGQLLGSLPQLAAQATAGQVSAEHLDHVGVLSHKIGADRVVEFDPLLAVLATDADPGELAEACEQIHAHVDPAGATPDPLRDFEARGLSLFRRGSMLALRGQLDPGGWGVGADRVGCADAPTGPGRCA